MAKAKFTVTAHDENSDVTTVAFTFKDGVTTVTTKLTGLPVNNEPALTDALSEEVKRMQRDAKAKKQAKKALAAGVLNKVIEATNEDPD